MKKIVNYIIPVICLVAIVFSVAAFNKAEAATPAGQPVDLTYAAEKALPSVVYIKYVQNSKIKTVDVQSDPFSDFFSDPFGGFFGRGNGGTQKRQIQTPKKEAAGSGVIISADGYIVTNNHVVDGADELTVTLNDNSEYSARIIGADKTTDLALIKIYDKTQADTTTYDSPFQHRVLSYQRYQGEKLRRRFNAYSYYRLLQAYDSHNLGRDRGSVAKALRSIRAHTLVVSITSDLLFPPADHQVIVENIPNCQYHVIDSDFGHDGFLVESEKLNNIIQDFLVD